ncbi:MAG: ClpXP protease specificity-enhancing factor [Idiomarina sp.]|nr:ClpXP protease specificity-enhancing factor [Idiomarina sp.]
MSPQRPYLLRALFDWLLDNGCTPHVVVDATQQSVEVPQEHVQEGQIVLNVHPDAVTRFTMDLEHISFEARFSGAARRIWLPMAAIVAIYGRENGAGTIFEPEAALGEVDGDPVEEPSTQKPELSAVSEETADAEDENTNGHAEPGQADDDKPKPKGRPSLKVVK